MGYLTMGKITIDGKEVEEIIITDHEGEVLAVVSASEIIEKNGVSVVIHWNQPKLSFLFLPGFEI